ncbi:S41 family peptidase [Bacteroides sp.]|uniref:S41 family peptidase n=1 Tax=Bacteroides sp. TaxID=29523 RepID=UPI00261245B6|nr:S41 family peptidase [Bacteroides sp.]MDD3039236.1 S41 family peptidase [Bacteroides sp.]
MMTNLRKIFLIPALIITFISGFVSCGVDRWPEYAHQTALDSWMYNIMQQNYLWYQSMPSYNNVNLFLDPASFLSKVKTNYDSYSFVDSIMETPLPTYGFDYSLVRSQDIDTAYNALITYVIPGSPAEKAGLQRGNWIMKVDTSYISKKYEVQLLQGTRARDLVMGVWKEVIPEVEEGEEQPDPIYKVVPNDITLKMGAAQIVEDNPFHKSEILDLSTGKVGYLMYNSFTAGTKDDSEKYNNELRKWSAELAQQNINKVILDLRYNAGGTLDCVQLLSTMFVPSYYLDQNMTFLEYNDKNIDKDATLTFDQQLLKSGKNLDLNTLIVLISGETAGAPEMLMNNLNGKIQKVIAIGASTKGQNVATEKFINEEFLWAINPVVCTVYNSDHVTYGKFEPNYSVSSSTDYSTFLPFGDPKETLLSIAIGVLEGTYPPVEPENPEEGTTSGKSIKIEKSVSSPASRLFMRGLQLK